MCSGFESRKGLDFLSSHAGSCCAGWMTSCLVGLNSLVHVQLYETSLVQLLPQAHFHTQVVVDEEAHWVVAGVVVVVRVVLIVRGHEAVCAHLQSTKETQKQKSDDI